MSTVRRLTHRFLLWTLLLACGAAAAPAGSVRSDPSARTSLSLTLYPGDLALVQEVREVDIGAGVSDVELAGVAARIDPATVQLRALSGDPVTTLEQRFEHDLLTPERLLQQSIGRPLQLVTREGGEELRTDAVLLSLRGGRVYRIGDRIWIDHPGEVVLPDLPEGLRDSPALIWSVDAARRGRRQLELAYLTGGLGWSADYVLQLAPDGRSVDLTGWVTLRNDSGVDFADASLRLVAGDVRRVSPRRGEPLQSMRVAAAEMERSQPQFEEETAFEYHVYDLSRRVTLAEAESRQVLLLGASQVPARRRLLFQGPRYSPRAPVREPIRDLEGEIELTLSNRRSAGPGQPLPAGIARAYQSGDDGRLLFLGEDHLPSTPVDGEVRLRLGRAFDVTLDRVQTDYRAVAAGRYDREAAFRLEIRNRKSEAVEVVAREPVPGDWKLLESEPAGERPDAGTLEFQMTIPAGGTQVITYRVALDTE